MSVTAHKSQQPSPSGAQPKRDVSRPRLDFSRLRNVQLRAYLVRFLFGGAISVIAMFIGRWTNPIFGGVFTAFPAILIASLTLIGKDDGKEQAAEDAEGGILGAIAFVCAALFITLTVVSIAGIISLLAALIIWVAIAIAIYLICIRVGILRTYQPADQKEKQGTQTQQ